jgi:DNA-binding NarL/FixJ family response regulator
MIAMTVAPSPNSNEMTVRRVLLVDDHPGFRRGLSAVIGEESDFSVCGEAATAPAALDAMRKLKPELAIVDISMPGNNGIELIKSMVAEQPHIKILVLSMHDESVYALRALRAGAKGYIMKAESLECVIMGLRKVAADEIYVSPRFSDKLIFKAIQSNDVASSSPVDRLSDRELEVLRLLGKGYGTRDIAEQLHLSVKTVETHRGHIKEKLGFKESGDMVRFAIDWVSQEDGEELTADKIVLLRSAVG